MTSESHDSHDLREKVDLESYDWSAFPTCCQLNALLLEVTTAPYSSKRPISRTSSSQVAAVTPIKNTPTSPLWSNDKGSTWNVSRPGSGCSRYTLDNKKVINLPDDILHYVLSFLWPIRELYNLRLARKCLKQATELLTVRCCNCEKGVTWQEAVVCDTCFTSSCRTCADVQLMPKESFIKSFNVRTCHSCKGRMQSEWDSCPWCGTLRTDLSHRLRLRNAFLKKTRAWIPHPCGHSMMLRRTCRRCIMVCTQCHGVACEKCIWRDGSRRACFGCTISCGGR